MADIELAFRIPESILNTIQADEMISREQLAVLQMHILKGTPLPKGHGDLIDRKALMDNGYQMEPVEMWYGIKYAPTIIEADKEWEVRDKE